MSRTAWRFVDPETTDEYFWPVNPYEDGNSHSISKSIGYQVQAGMRRTNFGVDTIDNLVHLQNVNQQNLSYTGNVYDKNQMDNLISWFEKEYPVELYDDLGRGFLVYITSFDFKRVRSNQNPYKHSYTFTGIVLGEL